MSFLPRLRPGREAARRRPVTARPGVEPLEDRTLPAVRMVVPLSQPADNVNTFHDLTTAINAPSTVARDVIQIEPGSSPGSAVVNKALLIQDDLAFGPAVSPQVGSLTLATSGSVLLNLNVGAVTINNGVTGEAILKSRVGSITQNVGPLTNGFNFIALNTITGPVVLGSAAGSPVASGDQVLSNAFVSGKSGILLDVASDNNALIRDNSFQGAAAGVTGVEVDDSTGVVLLNNRVLAPGSGSVGLLIDNPTRATSVVARDNRLDTGGQGTGIATVKTAGTTLTVNLANNDLVRDLVGLRVTGDGTVNADALGTIDAGGGPLGSAGGNDFHLYFGGSHLAIVTANALPTTDTVSARFNIFSTTPGSVVMAGAGSIDVSSPLSQAEAFVDRLYDNFLGRSASPGPGGELAFWAGQLSVLGPRQVAHQILFSPEGLAHTADRLLAGVLGRLSNPVDDASAGQLLGRLGVERFLTFLLTSPEFQARANTLAALPGSADQNFVEGLFVVLFGRNASPADLTTWVSKLQSVGRNGLVSRFVTFPEFRFRVINQLYFADVNLPPTALASYFPNLLHRSAPPPASDVLALAQSRVSLSNILELFVSAPEFMIDG